MIKLIPFSEDHVDIYHKWLLDPEICYLTGSEPMTVEQIRASQLSFLSNNNNNGNDNSNDSNNDNDNSNDNKSFDSKRIIEYDGIPIGDIQIFPQSQDEIGEISLMIVDEKFRGHGIGNQVLKLYLDEFKNRYKTIVAKVKYCNIPAIKLFKKNGFMQENSIPNIFEEIELKLVMH